MKFGYILFYLLLASGVCLNTWATIEVVREHKVMKERVEKCGQAIQNLDYQVEVLTELQKQTP